MPTSCRKISFGVFLMILLSTAAIQAQEAQAALENGRPVLKFADSKGCSLFINYGFLDGRDEALGVPVIHWHGGKMGEAGLLFFTKTALIFRPLEPHEHAFVIPRSTFVTAKVSTDGGISYLTIKSKVKKNQEFSIGCSGPVRDAGFDFPNVLNYITQIANDFESGLAEFKKQIAHVNSKPGTAEVTARHNIPSPKEVARRKEHFQIAEQEVIGLLNQADKLEKEEGNLGEAITLLERALGIAEKIYGIDHPLIAITLTQMAGVYYPLKGDLDRAENLYLRAISIGEKLSLQRYAYFPAAIRGLADVLSGKGDHGKAETLYLRGIALTEERSGVENHEIVVHLNSLAMLYKSKSDYGKAEQLYRRALKINEKSYGQDDPNVVLSLFHLGLLYQVKGDYDLAEAHLKRAIEIAERKLTGHQAKSVSVFLSTLASLYMNKEEYERAEPLLKRALSLTEEAWGTEHFSVAMVLANLGVLQSRKEDYVAAEKTRKRVLGIFEKTFGPGNKLTADATGPWKHISSNGGCRTSGPTTWSCSRHS